MKKFLMPALIIVIIIQLFVPIFMIAKKYDVLKTGEEFKFSVQPIDPYDAFRGRYVSLNVDSQWMRGKYATVEVGEDGFAHFRNIGSKKPESGVYVKSSVRSYFHAIDRYYMDEKFAPKAEQLVRERRSEQEAYVTVRVKNGQLVVSGLFIDGVVIEDILRNELPQ